ncbi:cell adhesion molecule CEACAM6-like isoform X3 [Salvelinus sp. IW2-2015]|uniref:cell adhesion molecule CEACAM6-like isoform X3 n=1 Tax=Salvelinus sp. IW2-2015 TaxID=2691554 RepID=UPI0038D4981D
MALRTAGSVLVVFIWSVAVVLGQNGWSVTYTTQSICTLKGSSVEMSCSYTYPSGYMVTTTFWFTKYDAEGNPVSLLDDPDYYGRLTYHRDKKNSHTLRITDLRESDSATYKFSFITDQTGGKYTGDPGVTLSVTGLLVKVTPAAEGQKTLTCSTTCTLTDNPTYIWYKNGQRLDEPTSQQHSSNTLVVLGHSADSYSCTVEHHEALHSPAVYAPKNTSVSVTPSGEIVEGSSVTLTCSSDANPPVDKYTWYKKNVNSPKASGQSYSITNIISEDRGEYYCEAENTIASMNSTTLKIIIAGKQTSVLTAAVGIIVVVLVLILCLSGFMWFRRSTGGSDATTDTQSVRPDCNSDTYTGLNMRTMSPDYDTLASVHPDPTSDPNSDIYTPLNMKTRSPEYDTLANVRGPSH